MGYPVQNRYFNYQRYSGKTANLLSKLSMIFRILAIPFVFGAAYFSTASVRSGKNVFTPLLLSLLGACAALYLISLLCSVLAKKREEKGR